MRTVQRKTSQRHNSKKAIYYTFEPQKYKWIDTGNAATMMHSLSKAPKEWEMRNNNGKTITKTSLFKYTENFTTKKMKTFR